jgi:hypothetical protein
MSENYIVYKLIDGKKYQASDRMSLAEAESLSRMLNLECVSWVEKIENWDCDRVLSYDVDGNPYWKAMGE